MKCESGSSGGRDRRSKRLDFTPEEIDRLRKLEFVHSIGLIPVFGSQKITKYRYRDNTSTEGSLFEEPFTVEMAKEDNVNVNNSNITVNVSVINPNSETMLVNTSDTTEPEDEDEDDFSSRTSTSSESRVHQQSDPQAVNDAPKRKSYEDLARENNELRYLLDLRNKRLSELERDHAVITDENALVSLEIQDIQRSSKEEKMKLEAELNTSEKEREALTRTVRTLREGVGEINKTLLNLMTQLNEQSNSWSSTFLPLPFNKDAKKTGRNRDCNSTSLAVVPSPLNSPETPTRPISMASTSPADNTSPGSRTRNVIQIALQRLDLSGKLGAKNAEPSSHTPTSHHGIPVDVPIPTISTGFQTVSKQTRSGQVLEMLPRLWSSVPFVSKEEKKPRGRPLKIEDKKRSLHAVNTKRQEQGFYCTCGVSVTTKLGLMTHIRYYTSEGQFRCTVKECGRRFFTTSTIRQHMKVKHNLVYSGREGCRKCGATFLSRMQLYLHCKNIHKCGPLIHQKRKPNSRSSEDTSSTFSSSNIICNRRCPLEATSCSSANQEAVSERHIAKTSTNSLKDSSDFLLRGRHELDTSSSKSGSTSCWCVCGREFSSKQYLRMHIRYHNLEPKFPCKVCGKLYFGTNYLRQHLKTKHGITYTGNGCRDCGRVFKNRKALHAHRKSFHARPVDSIENKSRPQLLLKNHPVTKPAARDMMIATSPSSPSGSTTFKRRRKVPAKYLEETEEYPSRQPSRELSKARSSFPVHTVDTGCTTRFLCTCGTPFTTRSALLSHVKLRTTGRFPCSICRKKFPRTDYLRRHVLKNHGSLKLTDGKNESVPSALNTSQSPSTSSPLTSFPAPAQHGIKSLNPRRQIYKCLCGTQFTRKETLGEHIRLKLGLTQFKCYHCQAAFSRHDYLKLHMQRVHKLLTSGFACRVCGCGGFSSTNDVKIHRSIYHNNENGNQDPLLALTWEG